MNQTGIIRKIDNLGRIVLPKELRKHLNINPGDDFQILLNGEKIILEKYSYISNNENEIIDIINCFNVLQNYDINLIVNNKVINKNQEQLLEKYNYIIKERKQYIDSNIKNNEITKNIYVEGRIVLTPIVINSDLLGSLLIISKDSTENIINYSKIIIKIIKKYYK